MQIDCKALMQILGSHWPLFLGLAVRTFVRMRKGLDSTTLQVGFFILAFLGFLFLGEDLGATRPSKHIRTGVQVPTKAKLSFVVPSGRHLWGIQ
jgi:hypothetical protein